MNIFKMIFLQGFMIGLVIMFALWFNSINKKLDDISERVQPAYCLDYDDIRDATTGEE